MFVMAKFIMKLKNRYKQRLHRKMGALEKINEVLAKVEDKKDHIRNFILLLMIEWKDFEGHLELTQKCFKECVAELQFRESLLKSVQESVSKSSEEMDLTRKSIEKRLEELEEKEKEFFLIQENGNKELGSREERLSLLCQQVEVREEKLAEQEKLIQGLFEKIELEQKQFEILGNSFDEMLRQLKLKENQIEKRVNEVDLKEQKVRQHEKEIEMREKVIDLKKRLIELKEKECYSKSKKSRHRASSQAKCDFLISGKGKLAHSWLKKSSRSVPAYVPAYHEQNDCNHQGKKQLDSTVDGRTLWTCCPFCGVSYDCFTYELNKILHCKNCLKSFIVFSSACSDQGYADSMRFKSNRNTDAGGDVRKQVVAENVNYVDVPMSEFVVLGMNYTDSRKFRELSNKSSKRRRTCVATKTILVNPIFGVNGEHDSRISSEQTQLVSGSAAACDVDDIVRSSKRLQRIKSCSCCEDEQNKVRFHNNSGRGNSTGFAA